MIHMQEKKNHELLDSVQRLGNELFLFISSGKPGY